MTNASATPEKKEMRRTLFDLAVKALEENGWVVARGSVGGKSSVRRMSKGGQTKTVSIRTSQDQWIAFPRNDEDTAFATLEDVDYVVAATIDDRHDPRFANIHLIAGDEMRDRFARAYTARQQAGHVTPKGRGIWLSLYDQDSADPVSFVGAGAGLTNRAIARYPLSPEVVDSARAEIEADADSDEPEAAPVKPVEAPITIAEAKRLLALSLGVDVSAIKITIEG